MHLNINAIPNFVAAFIAFFMGVIVLSRDRKSSVNVSFFLMSVGALMWQGGTGLVLLSTTPQGAFFFTRVVGFIGIAFLPIVTYRMAISFIKGSSKRLLYVGYLANLLFFVPLSCFTRLMFDGAYKFPWGYWYKASILHPFFLSFFCFYMVLSFYKLYMSYHGEKIHSERNRKRYLLLAVLIAYIGVVDYIPTYGFKVYPFGYVVLIICYFIIAYAIVKYRLMGIKVAVTRAGIFLVLYTAILGIPFYIGYQSKSWTLSTSLAVMFATAGPFIYRSLQRKAESILLAQQRRYHDVLLKASEDILACKEEEELLSRISDLIFDNVPCLFLGIYLRRDGFYEPKMSRGKFELPDTIDENATLISELREQNILHDVHVEGVSVSLVFSVGQKGNVKGFLVMGEKKNKEIYSSEDVETFKTLLNQVSLALENIQHIRETVEEQKEKERLKKEMEMAKQIQQRLLPQLSPSVQGLDIEGILLSAKEVAGDYYDFISYFPHRVGVVVADVSGKGMDAGMVMSMTKSTIYLLSEQELSPRDLVLKLNGHLCKQIQQQKFISLIYAEYSSMDNTFTWAGAGHEHILICRSGQSRANGEPEVEVIKTGGIVLGMFEDIDDKIIQQSVSLNSGDRLILYTDGVTEARNPQDDMFTLPRLIDSVKGAADFTVKDLLSHIKDEIQNFIKEAPQYDDITLVVMGRD